MNKKSIDVIVAGHVCLDITPIFRTGENLSFNQIFIPGKLTNMSGVNISAAGTVPNVGISLGILGMDTKLMGKIGNDYFGEGVLKLLKERNLDDGMIVLEGGNTSYSVVIVPPGVDRIFLHDPGANDTFCADDIDYELVKQARLFHFGYPPIMKKMYQNDGEELIKIFKRVKELGVITSLDMAFTEPTSESGRADWEKILKGVLPYVDVFIPSVEETLYMVKRDYFNYLNENNEDGGNIIDKLDINVLQEVGETLVSYGAKVAVIKCGIKGYYARTQKKEAFNEISKLAPIDSDNWSERELIVETYDVSGIKSATGAGDSSIAGFLAALLNGKHLEDSVKIAHAVATQSIQAYDVFSNIKEFDVTAEMIKGDTPLIKLAVEGAYWEFDKDKAVWRGQKDNL